MAILKDTLEILGKEWSNVRKIITEPDFEKVAFSLEGIYGRKIRKLVLYACTFDKEVAIDINKLNLSHIKKAIKIGKEKKI